MSFKHYVTPLETRELLYQDFLAKAKSKDLAYEAFMYQQDIIDRTQFRCKGIPDKACNYLAHCSVPCNKCGNLHDGLLNEKLTPAKK